MKVIATEIPDVVILEPKVFRDERGYFIETFNRETFREMNLPCDFVQDNHSWSESGVLRGLHYQLRHVQGKLVRVVEGEVFDVAVDLRRSSPTFARWVGVTLSGENHRMLWIPPGFAHGFLVTKQPAHFLYKVTAKYDADSERTIVWNDPDLSITWPVGSPLVVSGKDRQGKRFREAEVFEQ